MLELLIANKNYSSWSLRPWVLLRECGIAFRETVVPFAVAGQPSSFFAFSPTGKVPCLRDGDRLVWESLAIAEYLAERAPQVWPGEEGARAWARSASAEMHAGFAVLREVCSMNCGLRIRIDPFGEAVLADVARIDALWNEGLTRYGGPFLAGASFTAVDAFFAPVVSRFLTYDPPRSATARAYGDHILALASMREWYAAALAETWRIDAYEEHARTTGTVTADLRAGVA